MDDKDLIIQRLQNDIDKLEDEPKSTHSNLVDRNALIDANLFWEDLCENAEKGLMQSDSIEEVLNRQPTIDAVEVVRCKECKHRPKRDINGGIEVPKRKRVADWSCPYIRDGICITDDNFFCKAGERR